MTSHPPKKLVLFHNSPNGVDDYLYKKIVLYCPNTVNGINICKGMNLTQVLLCKYMNNTPRYLKRIYFLNQEKTYPKKE